MRMSVLHVGIGAIGAIVVAAGASAGSVVNGGFESGFTGWSTIGQTFTSITGLPAPTGSGQAYLQTGNPLTGAETGVTDAAIETFLGLSGGTLDAFAAEIGDDVEDATEGSAIKQTIMASAGDKLTFSFRLLTSEGTPSFFNDFGFVSLVGMGGTVELLADTSHPTFMASPTTPFFSQTALITFEHTFMMDGTFILGFGVMDVNDIAAHSALLIDDVALESMTIIPLPTPFGLAGAGLIGLAAIRRRR